MRKKITVNGREYSSVEEMPPEVRRQYEEAMSVLADRDGNGVPDIMESGFARMDDRGDGLHRVRVETQSHFVVNGKEYGSLDEMPPEVREMVVGVTRNLPDGGQVESSHTFETEIIHGDASHMRAAGTRRIAPTPRMAPGIRGGEKSSRGNLGWFVALILGLALIWALVSGFLIQYGG